MAEHAQAERSGEAAGPLASDPDPARALAMLESEMVGGEGVAEQLARLRNLLERECEAQVSPLRCLWLMVFSIFLHIAQMLQPFRWRRHTSSKARG